jgi:DNA repair exonuclease SbcCD ATPase subunit
MSPLAFASPLLAHTGFAAPAEGTSSTALFALLCITGCALAAAAWLYKQHTEATQRLQTLDASLKQLQSELKQTAEKDKKQFKELHEKREEVRSLKDDLALHKKKAHTAQEESKKRLAELKEQVASLEAQAQAKPAFAEQPAPAVVEPVVEKPVKAAPPPEPVHTPVVVRVSSPSEDALKLQIKTLEDAFQQLQKQQQHDHSTVHLLKNDLLKTRRRAEDLRRIDIINRGKTGLLEDKLKTLGRLYYEAISELAVLKGQVQPPRPRGIALEKAPTPAEDREAEAQALAEASDESEPQQVSA